MEEKYDVNIIVPIGSNDVGELRLALAIFGAIEMTNDDTHITVHSALDRDIIYAASDKFTHPSVIDTNLQ